MRNKKGQFIKGHIQLNTGKKNGMFGVHRFGKQAPNYGKKHTKEAKEKNRQAHLNKIDGEKNPNFGKDSSGKKNGNWKGGITPENAKIRGSIEMRLWREAVFARDNWTCQKHGIVGGKLRAHHIHNFADYPKLRTSIRNGITLSDEAHKEFHKMYGKKNNTKKQLKEFLNKN